MKQKRPQRRRKSDRITTHGSTVEEQQCDMAHAPFDHAAKASEKKWGIDRLPELVSPETAAIWGRTMANLNAALDANNPGDVIACVNSAIRGLNVMDAEATAKGHQPAQGTLSFEYKLEGEEGDFHFGVMDDLAEWPHVAERYPNLECFTHREVAIALKHWIATRMLQETRKHFPKAEVTKINQPKVDYANGGDDIPF